MDLNLLRRNERVNELYDAAFYAAGSGAQVKTTIARHLPEPFQRDPAMPHQPPVRYPDTHAIPGMEPSPLDRYRQALLSETLSQGLGEAAPMDIDDVQERGPVPLNNLTTDVLSQDELFKRAFGPRVAHAGFATTGW
jgi:hypothetical protein